MTFKHIGIIGLGLIGGSLAKHIRNVHPDCQISATDTDKKSLELAINDGVITAAFSSLNELPDTFDLLIVCTPIETTHFTLKELANKVKEQTIITDVASVKSEVLDGFDHIPNIVGGHPMAGTEFTGYQASSAQIMENAPYILIPSPTNLKALTQLESFLLSLGFRTGRLDAATHDKHVATTSHLPYLAACMVAAHAKDVAPDPLLYGPGYSSTTRVSKSNPNWGISICKANKASILSGIAAYKGYLSELEDSLTDNNWPQLNDILSRHHQIGRN